MGAGVGVLEALASPSGGAAMTLEGPLHPRRAWLRLWIWRRVARYQRTNITACQTLAAGMVLVFASSAPGPFCDQSAARPRRDGLSGF